MARQILVRCISILAVLSLGACGAATVPLSYQPQTFMKLSNSRIHVGDFDYKAALDGEVDSNQIATSAFGSIKLPVDVADYVKRATALELERAGLDIHPAGGVIITGRVEQFRVNDLGFSADWYYSVTYTVTKAGRILHNKRYDPPRRETGKFGLASDYSSTIDGLVRSQIESLIEDLTTIEGFQP